MARRDPPPTLGRQLRGVRRRAGIRHLQGASRADSEGPPSRVHHPYASLFPIPAPTHVACAPRSGRDSSLLLGRLPHPPATDQRAHRPESLRRARDRARARRSGRLPPRRAAQDAATRHAWVPRQPGQGLARSQRGLHVRGTGSGGGAGVGDGEGAADGGAGGGGAGGHSDAGLGGARGAGVRRFNAYGAGHRAWAESGGGGRSGGRAADAAGGQDWGARLAPVSLIRRLEGG